MCSFVSTLLFSPFRGSPFSTSFQRSRLQYRSRQNRLRASVLLNEDRDALEEKLRNGSQGEKMRAMISLPRLSPSVSVPLLHSTGVLRSDNMQIRLTAVATLGKLGSFGEGRTLLKVLRDDTNEDYSVRAAAANALGSLLQAPRPRGTELLVRETVSALIHAFTIDESFIVRYAAIVSLGNIGDLTALITLLPLVSDDKASALEVSAAIVAVGEVVPKEGVTVDMLNAVINKAKDPEPFTRAAVAKTLGVWRGVGAALAVLHKMRVDEERDGRNIMVQTILSEVLDNAEDG